MPTVLHINYILVPICPHPCTTHTQKIHTRDFGRILIWICRVKNFQPNPITISTCSKLLANTITPYKVLGMEERFSEDEISMDKVYTFRRLLLNNGCISATKQVTLKHQKNRCFHRQRVPGARKTGCSVGFGVFSLQWHLMGIALASFMSTWPKLESSEMKNPHLRKCLYQNWATVKSLEHFLN